MSLRRHVSFSVDPGYFAEDEAETQNIGKHSDEADSDARPRVRSIDARAGVLSSVPTTSESRPHGLSEWYPPQSSTSFQYDQLPPLSSSSQKVNAPSGGENIPQLNRALRYALSQDYPSASQAPLAESYQTRVGSGSEGVRDLHRRNAPYSERSASGLRGGFGTAASKSREELDFERERERSKAFQNEYSALLSSLDADIIQRRPALLEPKPPSKSKDACLFTQELEATEPRRLSTDPIAGDSQIYQPQDLLAIEAQQNSHALGSISQHNHLKRPRAPSSSGSDLFVRDDPVEDNTPANDLIEMAQALGEAQTTETTAVTDISNMSSASKAKAALNSQGRSVILPQTSKDDHLTKSQTIINQQIVKLRDERGFEWQAIADYMNKAEGYISKEDQDAHETREANLQDEMTVRSGDLPVDRETYVQRLLESAMPGLVHAHPAPSTQSQPEPSARDGSMTSEALPKSHETPGANSEQQQPAPHTPQSCYSRYLQTKHAVAYLATAERKKAVAEDRQKRIEKSPHHKKKRVEWDDELDEKLVAAYKSAGGGFWNSVSTQLAREGIIKTVEECEERFNSL